MTEPMIKLDDFLAVIEKACPTCRKAMTGFLAARLAVRPVPTPINGVLPELLEKISKAHGFPPTELVAKNNTPKLVSARRDFCYEARKLGYSLPQIARTIGKHHTTVMHLLRTHK